MEHLSSPTDAITYSFFLVLWEIEDDSIRIETKMTLEILEFVFCACFTIQNWM